MLKSKTISLIIPCRNEEKAIAAMLQKLPSCVDEVIVVDNNSRDKTAKVARSLGAKVLTEKRQAHGIGYGYAHQRGLAAAKGDIVITMDGDNTYPLESIERVISYMIKSESTFVSCTRFPLKKTAAISKLRQLGVWILNTEVRVLYNYPIKDILSGMWAVDRSVISQLSLTEGGWNLSPEIKLSALFNKNIAFSEYHITHHHRDNGASKQVIWKTGFEHLLYILKRRFTVDTQFNLIRLSWTE
ncbi:MAG: glycosyltransferase family 2 protein [bacterium]|nr:glycosyltransferase family 2 protein [bacterium]